MIFINKNLINIFNNIKLLEWIPVPERGYGSSGLLFENILGLKNNSLQSADYNGIEIKVKSIFSKFPLTLFSLCFNNQNFSELQRFVNSYGVVNKTYNVKVMTVKIKANEYTFWGKNIRLKLICDKKKKKIFLLVKHSNGKIIEKKCFWDYESLSNLIKCKITNICIVNCTWRTMYNFKFVNFLDISFFKLISFEKFLDAIEDGSIFVKIKCGVHNSGKNKGQAYYHGIEFQINYDDLFKIFN